MKSLLNFLLVALLLTLSQLTVYAQNDTVVSAPPIAKPRVEKPPLSERLILGGSFGLSLGTYTSVNLSPILGYKVTDNLVLGAGPTYLYNSVNYRNYKYKYSVYGGRLYGRQRVFDNFYAQAEYEVLNVQNYSSADPDARTWISAPLLGASYVQPIGNRSGFVISVLFNLNYQTYLTPYANPIIRVGFNL
jgi:hypothetical protein